jgi:hypothetical protein
VNPGVLYLAVLLIGVGSLLAWQFIKGDKK